MDGPILESLEVEYSTSAFEPRQVPARRCTGCIAAPMEKGFWNVTVHIDLV
jgi:hypothetical protein